LLSFDLLREACGWMCARRKIEAHLRRRADGGVDRVSSARAIAPGSAEERTQSTPQAAAQFLKTTAASTFYRSSEP
jgi:hypothetical protein